MIKKSAPAEPASLVACSEFIYDSVVPPNHLLRLAKAEMDFAFLWERVAGLYDERRGRPAISPELLGKVTFLQGLYHLSDRQVAEACAQRLDFKFFLDLPVEAPAPFEASTLCRVRARWGVEVFRELYEQSVALAVQKKVLGRKRSVDSSKTLMNAAVLRASQVLQGLSEKLLTALEKVVVPEVGQALREEYQALASDTSWWLSPELKVAHYERWGELAQELVRQAAQAVSCQEEDLARQGHYQRVSQYGRYLARHLNDEVALARIKARQQKNAAAAGAPAPHATTASSDEDDTPEDDTHEDDDQGEGGAGIPSQDGAQGEDQKPNVMTEVALDSPGKVISAVDPEARRAARRGGGVLGGYKTHIIMDHQSRIITALAVTPMNREDGKVLVPLVQSELAQGREIDEVWADSAYSDGEIRQHLQEQGIAAQIPEPRPKRSTRGLYTTGQFHYDEAQDSLTCPQGCRITGSKPKGEGRAFYYSGKQCAGCPLRRCCQREQDIKAGRGRTVQIGRHRALHDEARRKMSTPAYQEAMKGRLAIEAKQAEMLNRHGLRHARFRGLIKTTIQAYIVAMVVNVKNLVKPRKPALPKLVLQPN